MTCFRRIRQFKRVVLQSTSLNFGPLNVFNCWTSDSIETHFWNVIVTFVLKCSDWARLLNTCSRLIFNKDVFFMKRTFSAQQNLIVFSIQILKTAKFDIASRFAQSGSACRKKAVKNLSPKRGILTVFHYRAAPHGSVALALSRCDSFVWLWLLWGTSCLWA